MATDSVVEASLNYAMSVHKDEKRDSGDAYITHPVAVAEILRGWGVNEDELLAAAHLHDTIEDSMGRVKQTDLATKFSGRIADLVEGLSKYKGYRSPLYKSKSDESPRSEISKKDFKIDPTYEGSTLGNLYSTAYREPGILLIKLADRLHNLRTLGGVKESKKPDVAKETYEIYIPLAKKLGMTKVVEEMEQIVAPYIGVQTVDSSITDRWLNVIWPNINERIAKLLGPYKILHAADMEKITGPYPVTETVVVAQKEPVLSQH